MFIGNYYKKNLYEPYYCVQTIYLRYYSHGRMFLNSQINHLKRVCGFAILSFKEMVRTFEATSHLKTT